MNRDLVKKVLGQLIEHLEGLDAGELSPKPAPEEVSVEVESMEADPSKEPMEKSEKGPMEKLMEGHSPEKKSDDEELTDEELEELMKESLG